MDYNDNNVSVILHIKSFCQMSRPSYKYYPCHFTTCSFKHSCKYQWKKFAAAICECRFLKLLFTDQLLNGHSYFSNNP